MIEAPKGYHIERHGHCSSLKPVHGKERFQLRNREFSAVNDLYYGVPEVVIAHSLRVSNDEISVLDLGGGYASKSAQDIGGLYGHRVQVTNLDLVATPLSDVPNVKAVAGDALVAARHVAPESVDLAITSFFLPILSDPDGKKVKGFLKNVAKVLKSTGVALIDLPITHQLVETLKSPDINLMHTPSPDIPLHFMVLSRQPLPGILHQTLQSSVRTGHAFVEERMWH